MYLTENISLSEMTFSNTAIRHGIDNEPTEEQIAAMQSLAENVLQPVREHFERPLNITSGFRGEELNSRIGGAKNSQHMKGEAADIRVSGVHPRRVWEFIRDNLEFDQLIAEYIDRGDINTGWIHVSYKDDGGNRKEALSKRTGKPYEAGFKFNS